MPDPYLPPPPPAPPPPSGAAAPSPGSPTRAWGASRALLGIVVLILAATLEVSVIAAIGDPTSLAGKLVLQAMLAATLAGVAFALAGADGLATPAALGLRRAEGRPVRTALIGYGVYFAFLVVYASIVSPHQKDLTRSLGFGHSPVVSIIVGALIIFAAPVSEEIFFRGFLFGGLRRSLPFIGAALISAVIFGAFHYTGPRSLTVLPQLAVLGFVLAWVYERTGSIYPTIAIHVLNNALAFALLTS